MDRPTWDQYFITIARLTSKRSNCLKRHVGCVIVKDNRILSLGYNGTPRGTKNCFEGGCSRCAEVTESGNNLDMCMCLHAEENALLYVGQRELQDSTLYVSLMPCVGCVKKIIQCGIKKIVYVDNYNPDLDKLGQTLLSNCGIEVLQISELK